MSPKEKSLIGWTNEYYFLGLVKAVMEVKKVPFWLFEDKAFMEVITFGASCFYCEEDFLYWLDKFLNGLSRHSQELADRVSFIRGARELKRRYDLTDEKGKKEIREELLKSA